MAARLSWGAVRKDLWALVLRGAGDRALAKAKVAGDEGRARERQDPRERVSSRAKRVLSCTARL